MMTEESLPFTPARKRYPYHIETKNGPAWSPGTCGFPSVGDAIICAVSFAPAPWRVVGPDGQVLEESFPWEVPV